MKARIKRNWDSDSGQFEERISELDKEIQQIKKQITLICEMLKVHNKEIEVLKNSE